MASANRDRALVLLDRALALVDPPLDPVDGFFSERCIGTPYRRPPNRPRPVGRQTNRRRQVARPGGDHSDLRPSGPLSPAMARAISMAARVWKRRSAVAMRSSGPCLVSRLVMGSAWRNGMNPYATLP